MTVAKTIAHAWSDAAFKDKLVNDPHAALADHGVEVPEGKTVNVIQNTHDTIHVVLPVKPAEADQVSMDELENLAAGFEFDSGNYCL